MSYMNEIDEREAQEKILQKQKDHLEDLLQRCKRKLGSEERSHFEKEINKLKDELLQTEKELKRLRKENRKSFIFGLAIFILVILMLFYSRL